VRAFSDGRSTLRCGPRVGPRAIGALTLANLATFEHVRCVDGRGSAGSGRSGPPAALRRRLAARQPVFECLDSLAQLGEFVLGLYVRGDVAEYRDFLAQFFDHALKLLAQVVDRLVDLERQEERKAADGKSGDGKPHHQLTYRTRSSRSPRESETPARVADLGCPPKAQGCSIEHGPSGTSAQPDAIGRTAARCRASSRRSRARRTRSRARRSRRSSARAPGVGGRKQRTSAVQGGAPRAWAAATRGGPPRKSAGRGGGNTEERNRQSSWRLLFETSRSNSWKRSACAIFS